MAYPSEELFLLCRLCTSLAIQRANGMFNQADTYLL